MFHKPRFRPEAPFPEDLSGLSNEDLHRLAAQLQEEVFRESNESPGQVRQKTLMRQALIDLELLFRQGESGRNTGYLR